MERKTELKVDKFLKSLRTRKRWKKVVMLCCFLVVCITVSALTLPAISQSTDTYCGYEEHTHSDSCYEIDLICEFYNENIPAEESVAEQGNSPEKIETVTTVEITTIVEETTYISEAVTGIKTSEEVSEVTAEDASASDDNIAADFPEETTLIEITTEVEYETEVEITTEITEASEATDNAVKDNTADEKTDEPSAENLPFPEETVPENTSSVTVEHEHSEECYVKKLICEKEEHTHSDECRINSDADTETEEEWISAFKDIPLTLDSGADLLAIAMSQLGYAESSVHYIINADGISKNGYNRYGAWYGEPYADWNTLFVSFCAYYAKIDTVTKSDDCVHWLETLKNENSVFCREVGEYIPVAGDIVFFDTDENSVPDRVAIAKSVDEIADEIIVIEGDVDGSVEEISYTLSECGALYCITHPEKRTNKQVVLEQQEIIAAIYTDESHITLADDKTVITVSGELPAGATAKAHLVSLGSDFVEGQSLIVAYDITIIDEDGNVFNQAENGKLITVSIQPPEWDEEDNSLSVYYIPEEGSPESMNAQQKENSIVFETDHFSVYAVTRSGTLATVYLNGASGNDENNGSSSSPVKTFAKALELLADDGIIYISGTVTVTDEQSWSLGAGQKIQRASSFTDALIRVNDGGSLTLRNITINGGAANPSSSNIATNSTYATGNSKGPLIYVADGGTVTVNDGTILENNSNKPNMTSNKLVISGYIGMGGAVYCDGDLIMTGGTIRNCEAQCGGGVYLGNGRFYMSGGIIDNNYARDIVSYRNRVENYHQNAGGGVYVCDYSHMYMSGGTISNNQSSREGGGISLGWLDRSRGSAVYEYTTSFTMTGGTITGNYATSTGGGINITAGCEATISAGYITNNTADGKEYQDSSTYVSAGNYARVFSGGGIYLDAQQWDSNGRSAGVPARCVIHRVIITDNTATSSGGGIASCSTSNTTVHYDVDINDGTAIYGNTAPNDDEIYINQGTASIGNTVLGGGSYNWTKSGQYYKNSLTDTSSAIVKAQGLATVFITGNTGYLGGGIGCNGIISVGGEDDTTAISIEKLWVDTPGSPRPDYIIVQLYQNGNAYGEPVRIYPVINEDGEEEWPVYHIDDLPAGYVYTIAEVSVPGYTSQINNNSNKFTITNTITGFKVEKKWVDDEEADRPESILVQLYQNGNAYGEPKLLTADGSWVAMWTDLPETDKNGEPYVYTAREVDVPEGYICTDNGHLNEDGTWEIVNTKIPLTSVSAEKKWADGVIGAESITLKLLANGEQYGNSVKLSSENNWFFIWEELPSLDENGEKIEYTVEEERVSGYLSEITLSTEAPKTTAWTPVSSFTAGETYVLISSSGALTTTTTDTLEWSDISDHLDNGTVPAPSVLWTYNSARKLISGNGKYLNIKSSTSGWTTTYSFNTASSTSYTISYSSGRISTTAGIRTRYFSGIASGYGTTATSTGSAVNFTAYKLTEETKTIGEAHYVVTNTKRSDSMTIWFTKYILKEDENNVFPLLPGAEFSLYRWDEEEETIPGTSFTGILVDQWTSESAIGSNGGAHGVDLTDGIYYLVETKAPAGYAALSGPIIFEVDSSEGMITIIQYPDHEEMLPGFSQDSVITGNDAVSIPVYNSQLYQLPETGGTGTYLFTLGGLLLMAAALILLLYKKCTERRNGFFPDV